MNNMLLRNLPKVDEVLNSEEVKKYLCIMPREKVTDVIRTVTDSFREKILNDEITELEENDVINHILDTLAFSNRKSLRRVVNGTGVVLHTNLGRSNLSKEAFMEVASVMSNYSTLEYDPNIGGRGLRHDHIEKIVRKITGAESAMVVNNNAAATMIAMASIGRDKEIIVSRGELVEIGGSFRIPDIMEESQAKLIEVGTTNKTRVKDYKRKINDNTAAIMKVHTSNYKIIGFTESASLKDLRELCDKENLPLIYDMGSGLMIDLSDYGINEPNVKDALKDGADIVLFSGDKLLGGPQAGIIIGKQEYIDKMKAHPLARALRVDKMTIAALEATFNEYYDTLKAMKNIPVLNMLTKSEDELLETANVLREKIDSLEMGYEVVIEKVEGLVGGGSAPGATLNNIAVTLSHKDFTTEKIERMLRKGDIPIVVRIKDDKILIDTRTIFPDEIDIIVNRLKEIVK